MSTDMNDREAFTVTLEELFPLNSWVKLGRSTPWPGWEAVVVGHSGSTTLEVQLRLNQHGQPFQGDPHVVLLAYQNAQFVDELQVLARALDDEVKR